MPKATSETEWELEKRILTEVDLEGFLEKLRVELSIEDRLGLDRYVLHLKEFV